MTTRIKIAATAANYTKPVSAAMLNKVTEYLQSRARGFNYTFAINGDVHVWGSLGAVHGTNISLPDHAEMATALRLNYDVFMEVLAALHCSDALRRIGDDQIGYAYEVKFATLVPAAFAKVHAKDHAVLFADHGHSDPNALVPIIQDDPLMLVAVGGNVGLGSGLLPVEIVYEGKLISWRTCTSDVPPSSIVGWGRRGDYVPYPTTPAHALTTLAEQVSLAQSRDKLLTKPDVPTSSDPLNAAADELNAGIAELDAYLNDDASGRELIDDEKAGCARLVSAAKGLQERIVDVVDLYGHDKSI